MKLRRGCGCPILLLMGIDLFFFVGVIIALFQGSSTEPTRPTTLGSLLSLAVFAGNVIACALLAIAAFRQQGLQSSTGEKPVMDEYAGEGTDEEKETDEGA
jgi:hypothetical protein